MQAFGKEIGHGFVRLVHEIIGIFQIRQTSVEIVSRVFVEKLLVFAIAVYDPTGWRIDHGPRVFYESKDESRLAGARRSRHQGGKRMTISSTSDKRCDEGAQDDTQETDDYVEQF